jgi:hypothetical protein
VLAAAGKGLSRRKADKASPGDPKPPKRTLHFEATSPTHAPLPPPTQCPARSSDGLPGKKPPLFPCYSVGVLPAPHRAPKFRCSHRCDSCPGGKGGAADAAPCQCHRRHPSRPRHPLSPHRRRSRSRARTFRGPWELRCAWWTLGSVGGGEVACGGKRTRLGSLSVHHCPMAAVRFLLGETAAVAAAPALGAPCAPPPQCMGVKRARWWWAARRVV